MSDALRAPRDVLSDYPPHRGTLASLLESRVARLGDRELVRCEGSALGYAGVAQRARRAAAMFAARGVRAGDRIGVMSQNHVSTVITLFALARIGAVMVPLNPTFRAVEARYVLEHAGVCGVLCSPDALPIVREAASQLAPVPWLMLNERGDPECEVFGAAIERCDALPPDDLADPDAVCLFIYTSGTTGFPKGAMHAQRSVVIAGEAFVQRMYLQPDDRLLCIQPMFHINALFYSLAGAVAAGAALVLVPRFSASTFWQTVAETGATEVNTVAAISNILMRRPRSEFVATHRLSKIYGGPFSEEAYRVFHDEFGVETLIEGYAMTEIPGALSNPFAGPHRIGSMGTPCVHPDPAFVLTRMKVVDDEGREVGDGEIGELAVMTPTAMKGYYRDARQTAAAFRDGWFLTGDLGWRDADGYYWFVARKNDVIRKRGENISGAELDRVIEGHPAVIQAAAIAVPDDVGEEEILIAIMLKPGASLAAGEVAEWCRERLAPMKVPRYVLFVDALPRTPTHRVEKFRLRGDATLKARATDLAAGPLQGG